MSFDEFLNIPPYSLDKAEKERLLTERLTELTRLHAEKCPEYGRILSAIGFDISSDKHTVKKYTDLPFLPVRRTSSRTGDFRILH